MSEKEIIRIIQEDKWMMDVLRAAQGLNLTDGWVGGGFIRSKVWDTLHSYKERTPLPDVDVVYFNPNDFEGENPKTESTKLELKYEKDLLKLMPDVKWSVTNQARMHVFHNCPPYKNTEDALKDWVETATCIATRINKRNELELIAPWGISDLVNLILKPASLETERLKSFHERIESKGWLKKWPKLEIRI